MGSVAVDVNAVIESIAETEINLVCSECGGVMGGYCLQTDEIIVSPCITCQKVAIEKAVQEAIQTTIL